MRDRILIVEDEFLVGIQLEDDLHAAGYRAVGPYAKLEDAVLAARREQFDLAILDINLNGEKVFPLADELIARGIPIILISGYLASDLPERFRDRPLLAKPYDPTVLDKEISSVMGRR